MDEQIRVADGGPVVPGVGPLRLDVMRINANSAQH